MAALRWGIPCAGAANRFHVPLIGIHERPALRCAFERISFFLRGCEKGERTCRFQKWPLFTEKTHALLPQIRQRFKWPCSQGKYFYFADLGVS